MKSFVKLRLDSKQHTKVLGHRNNVHVEFMDRRTYPVQWRFRKNARRRWTTEFCSRIRNINRRVTSVFASPSTWNVNRRRKPRVEGSRCCLLMDCSCFQRAVIPKSWSLLALIFVVKAVFIRNSMALCHLWSKRHRWYFASSSIVESSF